MQKYKIEDQAITTTGQLSLFKCQHSFYLKGYTTDENRADAYKWACLYCERIVVNSGWMPQMRYNNIDKLPETYEDFFKRSKEEQTERFEWDENDKD